jgi:4-azaleucine resistance transporter AzlC
MNAPRSHSAASQWTLAGFRQGAFAALPLLPGVFVFGLGFGTVAAGKGFSLIDTFIMSATVFSGMAQFIVLQSWPDQFTLTAIAGAGLITAMVSSRMLLMSAAMRPWFGGLPARRVYPSFFVLTDTAWIVAMTYHAKGGRDPAYFLGAGTIMWCIWVLSVAPGYWLGASLADPRTYGFDLVMPVFFAAMLVPLWRGLRGSIGWIVGGAVALAADQLFGGYWYVLAGALAGAVVGGLVDD